MVDLETVARIGRNSWPKISLTLAQLSAFLEQSAKDLDELLPRDRLADLYFACGCAVGDKNALQIFERELMPVARIAIAQIVGGQQLNDLMQTLRIKLLMPPAAIASYSGRGQLGAWVRIVARRHALASMRKAPKAPPVELPSVLPVEELDPELAYLRRRCHDEYKAACISAMEAISHRDKTLLTLYLVDRLSAHQIARIYAVHRTTMMRWLGRARERFITKLRAEITSQLGVGNSTAIEQLHTSIQLSLLNYLQIKAPAGRKRMRPNRRLPAVNGNHGLS